MKRIFAANLKPSRSRASRKGLATGLLLLMLVFLSGFVALGVNIVRLRQVQSELRTVCRTAALAGAAELLNEGVLYGSPDVSDDVYAARLSAVMYAGLNRVNGGKATLDPNTSNKPRGDVVIGWYDPSWPVGQPLVLPSDEAGCELNTIRVTARTSRNLSNRVTLWFGSLLGMTRADVAASAQASLDRRIVGFRPEPHVHVPVVPLAADYASWTEQTTAGAASGENDQFAVDPWTGVVTSASDGIPEVTLTFGGDLASTGWCAALSLAAANDQNTGNVWSRRCHQGLSQQDLQSYGGQLVAVAGLCPVALETAPPVDLTYCLMDIIGQCRAWPLAEMVSGGANVSTFAAGRIVAVRAAADSAENVWEIVVQPSTLVSSQAVASFAVPPNPWIAKLELTQ